MRARKRHDTTKMLTRGMATPMPILAPVERAEDECLMRLALLALTRGLVEIEFGGIVVGEALADMIS